MRSSPAKLVMFGLAIALVIAFILSPFASSSPDGLERVAEDHGFIQKGSSAPTWANSPFTEYETPGVEGGVSTGLAGVLGTLAAFAVGVGIARLMSGRNGSGEKGGGA